VTVAAIVPAAGRGERLGPGQPKALRELGGVPMLVHAVRALSRARLVDLVVVAAPADGVADVKALGNSDRRKRLLQESNELVSIYAVIVRKLKAR